MRIFVTGTRGIPDIPGGVEKHCQELYPRIAARGHEVILATRAPYVKERLPEWHGVHLVHNFAPRRKSLEAIIHTLLSVLRARITVRPDIVHIHAVGPGLVAPLARLLGLKVVMTHHGPDYDRQKWGAVAKTMLRRGEYLAGRHANEVIVISRVIAEIIERRCGRSPILICNGVTLPHDGNQSDYLTEIGVVPGGYVLAVARFVPEKGLHDLIAAYQLLRPGCKLVIAGDADHASEYGSGIKRLAAGDPNIILTGYITGEPLRQLYHHARLFVLPSYHEGLPIVLLEAMSHGVPLLASDIPANKEVPIPAERFFRCGDVQDLADRMQFLLPRGLADEERQRLRQLLCKDYNWDTIADQTLKVYERVFLENRTPVAKREEVT